MKYEEAVERILRGDAWVDCRKCEGEDAACDQCVGYGYFLDPDYAEACDVLGRPRPKAPRPFEDDALSFDSSQSFTMSAWFRVYETIEMPQYLNPEAIKRLRIEKDP